MEPPRVTISRAAAVERIGDALAGRLAAAALAKWAFDSFYRMELGEAQPAPGDDPLLDEVLDTLMFGDEPGFQLSDDELRALVRRLTAQV